MPDGAASTFVLVRTRYVPESNGRDAIDKSSRHLSGASPSHRMGFGHRSGNRREADVHLTRVGVMCPNPHCARQKVIVALGCDTELRNRTPTRMTSNLRNVGLICGQDLCEIDVSSIAGTYEASHSPSMSAVRPGFRNVSIAHVHDSLESTTYV